MPDEVIIAVSYDHERGHYNEGARRETDTRRSGGPRRGFAQLPPPATEQIRPAAENKLARSYRGPLPFSDVRATSTVNVASGGGHGTQRSWLAGIECNSIN